VALRAGLLLLLLLLLLLTMMVMMPLPLICHPVTATVHMPLPLMSPLNRITRTTATSAPRTK
jgi:hypothetical protein